MARPNTAEYASEAYQNSKIRYKDQQLLVTGGSQEEREVTEKPA